MATSVFAAKAPQPNDDRNNLLRYIRYECTVECMGSKDTKKTYDELTACTDECIGKPKEWIRDSAKQQRGFCTDSQSTEEELSSVSYCRVVASKRDLVEYQLNFNTSNGCPVGADFKKDKCRCPFGSRIDKGHTSCRENKVVKGVKEGFRFFTDLFKPDKDKEGEENTAPVPTTSTPPTEQPPVQPVQKNTQPEPAQAIPNPFEGASTFTYEDCIQTATPDVLANYADRAGISRGAMPTAEQLCARLKK